MEAISLTPNKKVTFEQLVKFINLGNNWLRRKPENALTKFGYAISRMLPKTTKLIRPLNKLQDERDQKIEALKLKHCYSNPSTKVIEYDVVKNQQGTEEQTYKYTVENKLKLNEEVSAILQEYDEKRYEEKLAEEVAVENPYFATEVPSDLTPDELRVFSNIVVPSVPEDKPITIDDVKKAIAGIVTDEAFGVIVGKLTA